MICSQRAYGVLRNKPGALLRAFCLCGSMKIIHSFFVLYNRQCLT
jgi:hypothetical protein